MEDTLSNQQNNCTWSKIAPRSAQGEAQRAEPCRGWELLQPLTPTPNTSNPAGSRQKEGTAGHRDLTDSKAEAGAGQMFVTLGCSMELLPVPDCCSGRHQGALEGI